MVESVNTSVLPYVPLRSPSVSAIDCLKSIATAALPTGAAQLVSGVEAVTGANAAEPVLTCSACGSEKLPLTRCPVAVEDGSPTVRTASAAVEVTVAVVDAV